MDAFGQHPDDTFTHRHIPALDRTVHRLGLAGNYGINAQEFAQVLEMGPQYLYWTPNQSKVTSAIRDAFQKNREHYVLATGPTLGWTPGTLSKSVDKARKLLKTDYIDVLQLMWLGKTSAWRPSVVKELVRLRDTDAVRSIGVSIHDRVRAGELAKDSPLDLLMIRYNAAHPGAEQDIFPHLHHRRPAVVSYTTTAWGKLLKAPPNWDGPPPRATDCYRFSLSNPHVDITLTGPANLSQFKENLAAIEDEGPLSEDEMRRMRDLGQQVRGAKVAMRFYDAI